MKYLFSAILLLLTGHYVFGSGVDEYDLFKASESALIETRFIPQNDKVGNIIIVNKTDRPLTIKLPSTFGAVPILAQIGPFVPAAQPVNNAGFGSGGIGATPQRLGGAIQNPNPNNPFAKINPRGKKVIKVTMVCLDYGAPTPTPLMPYQIVSLNNVTDNNTIASALERLSSGGISRRLAQAVAWHISSGLTWTDLNRTGLFNKQDILLAQQFCLRKEETIYSL